MNTFLITLLVVGIVIAAMAIGVMFGRKPIAGSCGGMGAMRTTGIPTSPSQAGQAYFGRIWRSTCMMAGT